MRFVRQKVQVFGEASKTSIPPAGALGMAS
jgi:hypothetical protein